MSLSLQITLYMGPYQFRKRSTRSNGIIQFTCVSCETEHRKSVTAVAQMSYDEDDKEQEDEEGDLFFNLESGEEDVTIDVPETSEIIVRGLRDTREIQETSNSVEAESSNSEPVGPVVSQSVHHSEHALVADRVPQVLGPVERLG